MNSEKLLHLFDAWEQRTRGYDTWPHRVRLEPTYYPFLAAQRAPREFVDDGRRPGLWERLVGRPKPVAAVVAEELAGSVEREASGEIVELQLLVPKDFSPKSEMGRRCLISLSTVRNRLSFEIVGRKKQTVVQIVCDSVDRSAVLDTLRAYFPETRVRQRSEELMTAWASMDGWGAVLHLGLNERVFRSLRRDDRGDVDPFIEIIGRLASLGEGELGLVQVLFEPARGAWADDLIQFGRSIDDVDRVLPDIEEKFREPLFAVVVRVAALAPDPDRAVDLARSLAIGVATSTRSETNELVLLGGNEHSFDTEIADVLERETRRTGMVLSLSEFATLAHLPSAVVRAEHLLRQATRTRAAPASAKGGELVLGVNEHEGEEQLVTLSNENRLRHTYCIGASGTGKSTLLLSMVAQDIEQGRGFAVLDPHGDLIEDILARIPEERSGDVVVFDPSDEDFPVGFNILSARSDFRTDTPRVGPCRSLSAI